MELTERQQTILDAVVREYVGTAGPVASEEIVKKYALGASSATVRNEMQALDEGGFLTQPHTSAGRIPTDRGYRFFINHLLARNGVSNREERAVRELRGLDDPTEFMRQASRLVAHLTRNFVLTGFPAESVFFHSGIGEVVQEPEFADTEVLHEFSALIDTIEDELSHHFENVEESWPQAFVGKENPIRSARHCGMIISRYELPERRAGVIALIGPKRMDYEYNLALLRHLQELFS